jgi:hypothetical protein
MAENTEKRRNLSDSGSPTISSACSSLNPEKVSAKKTSPTLQEVQRAEQKRMNFQQPALPSSTSTPQQATRGYEEFFYTIPSNEQFKSVTEIIQKKLLAEYGHVLKRCASLMLMPLILANDLLVIYVGCPNDEEVRLQLPECIDDVTIFVKKNWVRRCGKNKSEATDDLNDFQLNEIPRYVERLQIGMEIGSSGKHSSGTLGGFVKDTANNDKVYGISCYHVVMPHETVQQPAEPTICKSMNDNDKEIIELHTRHSFFVGIAKFGIGEIVRPDELAEYKNWLDYTLIDFDTNIRQIRTPLNSLEKIMRMKPQYSPAIRDITDKTVAEQFIEEKRNMYMMGAVSGMKKGYLVSADRGDVCIKVEGEYELTNEFSCAPFDSTDRFALEGDSGAIVFTHCGADDEDIHKDKHPVVGLLFAISDSHPKVGFITPIKQIIDHCSKSFGVEMSF